MSDAPPLSNDDAMAWFSDQVPEGWFTGLRVMVDRDEIMVMGTLDRDEQAADDPSSEQADLSHIQWFREETRESRIAIAQRAEAKFGRKVSWATGCGHAEAAFTHLSVPVMTRLRIGERQLLDTLVSAGVARSRSDALGWCVRLVARHEGDWLEELREAIDAVDKVRAQGPN